MNTPKLGKYKGLAYAALAVVGLVVLYKLLQGIKATVVEATNAITGEVPETTDVSGPPFNPQSSVLLGSFIDPTQDGKGVLAYPWSDTYPMTVRLRYKSTLPVPLVGLMEVIVKEFPFYGDPVTFTYSEPGVSLPGSGSDVIKVFNMKTGTAASNLSHPASAELRFAGKSLAAISFEVD